jgi:hypothetical protein
VRARLPYKGPSTKKRNMREFAGRVEFAHLDFDDVGRSAH